MQGEPASTLESRVSYEEGRNISLDFEGRLRPAVGLTIMNVVCPLSDEALDCVVAGGDWDVHRFGKLGVSHEVD